MIQKKSKKEQKTAKDPKLTKQKEIKTKENFEQFDFLIIIQTSLNKDIPFPSKK